jgi:hypothetical protein
MVEYLPNETLSSIPCTDEGRKEERKEGRKEERKERRKKGRRKTNHKEHSHSGT